MMMGDVKLLEKSGGKSGGWIAERQWLTQATSKAYRLWSYPNQTSEIKNHSEEWF
jgi:hypothetical protein